MRHDFGSNTANQIRDIDGLLFCDACSIHELEDGRPVRGVARASDRQGDHTDLRIAFFQQLVTDLEAREEESDDDLFISLISFNGNFANVRPEYATSTLNKDIIRAGLTELARDEEGLRPLADSLRAALERVIFAAGNLDLNPIVILFTDAVERAADRSFGGEPRRVPSTMGTTARRA